ncbi:molybdopterin oxidoreductase family protein [Halogeometricum sp. S1BR25-6]|uniref:Molybdopterin oxidoreductase family protein n=1 Tax=Halogeometricum salsisoli TaxID=2950536 RepID=A0ABU2GAY3_9EURY|nr:assimilatory nitrate reductase NasA [Halogeometricum sp. S1BR25-6]MDS0297937.1 molybdopterin oxidoreductase family protein [Halogeometricum sp. S1BR25-6]
MTDPKPTTCMRCAVGCGYLQEGAAPGRGVADVSGHSEHPTSGGRKCRRGVRETVDPKGERLTTPLIRRGDSLHPTDWDTALGVVATRLIEAIRKSPTNVAVLGSGQQTNEAAYALGKVARGVFGTPHYDANTTLCMASAVTAYYQAFGSDAPPPTYDDIPEADTHVVWGANPAVAHPVMYRWIADSARDGDLIVVDPVSTKTAAEADVHVQPDPGTDLALARAVLAHLVESDDVDQAFVDAHTDGFERMVESLPDAETAAATAGVPLDRVAEVASALDAATLLYWGMGVNQSVQGTATARALIDLCLATGNLGPGSGPFSLTGQANSMGNRVCASKGTWPGHRAFTEAANRERMAEVWDVPLTRLPDSSGPGFVSIVDGLARGDIDVCWTVATNPVAGMPDAGYVKRALDDAFLVVQDAFRSDTLACADVVLPAATWGESTGTVMNMERRVSPVTAVNAPPGSARQDLDIIAAVGNRIDPDAFDGPPVDPESVFDELRGLTAGTTADISGITYDRLERDLAVRWPAPDEDTEGGYRYYDGGEWSFHTDSGRAQFSTAVHSAVPEPIDEEYPLTLTTGRESDTYNTGVRTRGAGETDKPTARMHPQTIADCLLSIDRGETVIESRRASVVVEVAPNDGVPPGVVWLSIHNAAANELTLSAVDPESAEPNLKQCAVALQAPERAHPERERDAPVLST